MMSMPSTTHADTSSAERDTHAVSDAPSSDPSSTAAAASNGCAGGRVKLGMCDEQVCKIGRDSKYQPQTVQLHCLDLCNTYKRRYLTVLSASQPSLLMLAASLPHTVLATLAHKAPEARRGGHSVRPRT